VINATFRVSRKDLIISEEREKFHPMFVIGNTALLTFFYSFSLASALCD
tara:strand:- start:17327 stop:17473 length:147 start_codon:yes stop_codon:yes gene_type:complete